MPSIEDRIQAIEDRDEIRELTARYCHAVRDGAGEAVVELFTEDGALEMNDRKFEGHGELRQAYGASMRQPTLRAFIQNHVIDLDGDRATGQCSVEIRAVEKGRAFTAAGHYDDTYRRDNGSWRFARRLLHIYHWVPLADGWGDDAEGTGPPNPLE